MTAVTKTARSENAGRQVFINTAVRAGLPAVAILVR
jgi:hypothetical protein